MNIIKTKITIRRDNKNNKTVRLVQKEFRIMTFSWAIEEYYTKYSMIHKGLLMMRNFSRLQTLALLNSQIGM